MLKWFFDISTGFRFQRSVWECSVHICSCPCIREHFSQLEIWSRKSSSNLNLQKNYLYVFGITFVNHYLCAFKPFTFHNPVKPLCTAVLEVTICILWLPSNGKELNVFFSTASYYSSFLAQLGRNGLKYFPKWHPYIYALLFSNTNFWNFQTWDV